MTLIWLKNCRTNHLPTFTEAVKLVFKVRKMVSLYDTFFSYPKFHVGGAFAFPQSMVGFNPRPAWCQMSPLSDFIDSSKWRQISVRNFRYLPHPASIWRLPSKCQKILFRNDDLVAYFSPFWVKSGKYSKTSWIHSFQEKRNWRTPKE